MRSLRGLAGDRVKGAEPVLVRALTDQSGYLAALDRHGEALALAEEAASLSWAAPERAQLLATALVTLANRLVRAGRLDEARDAERKATSIVEALPETALARGLSALALAMADAGEHAEAVVISERALEMWRRLAQEDPGAEARLGQSLSDHADRLSELGRWADAVEYSAECVAHRRRTATEELAKALKRHAVFLDRVGREQEAHAAADEAAEGADRGSHASA
ncbi:tetratricopeptide repeat protein [Actinoplanes sp. NPDC023714]|uniref:tetratricopeptide repeat protein n=1 Tax=Actinoplanes sp. NPDC023714 TaxID=3154322 RepID=UPI0033D60ECB